MGSLVERAACGAGVGGRSRGERDMEAGSQMQAGAAEREGAVETGPRRQSKVEPQ